MARCAFRMRPRRFQCGYVIQIAKRRVRRATGTISPILKLDGKLGVILIQLPLKLEFDAALTSEFFQNMRSLYCGPIAVEPRNGTWSSSHCLELFHSFRVARVIADPNPLPNLSLEPFASSSSLTYFRLHGSPEIYKSHYAILN